MILTNTTTKTNTLHIVLREYCDVQEQSFASRFCYRESVRFVLPSTSEVFVHRHLPDDLGLDLQVANGLVTIAKSIFGTDSKYL